MCICVRKERMFLLFEYKSPGGMEIAILVHESSYNHRERLSMGKLSLKHRIMCVDMKQLD